MKKFSLVATVLALAFSVNAQLKVESNGQVCIGEFSASGPNIIEPNTTTSNGRQLAASNRNDTVAALMVRGDIGTDKSRTIAFGFGSDVYIKEVINTFPSYKKNNILEFGGKGGLIYKCGDSNIMIYDPVELTLGTGACFNFNVPVNAPQYLTRSDANLKTNVTPLELDGKLLMDITPVSYKLKSNANKEQSDKASALSSEDVHRQYGFIAQEVKEIYPDLVFEDSDGILSIDYTGFIPILVDAVKNLETRVKEQELEIDSLKNQLQNNRPLSATGAVVASLSQNRPNPFRDSTSIQCIVPESVITAFICVYDLNGNQKLRKNVQQRGKTEVTIDGNTLSAGMYIYTLICDGQEIDSKRMILTD